MSYSDLLLQNLAAESDPRTTASDDRWWVSIRGNEALYPESGDGDNGAWIQVRFEVCPLCDGRGKYVNPSIDAHGLTRDDFDEDPDFEESYFRGDYDIRCTLCEGEKVVPVPLDPELIREIEGRAADLADMRVEMLAEIRMGA